MSVGSTHHLEVVFVWKQNYILVDEYFFFCCTWIVNSAAKSRDLDARFQEVYAFLHNELDTADVEEIADRVMWDNNSDIEDFADILSPRLGSDCSILVCLYANSFGFIYAQRSQQFIWYF